MATETKTASAPRVTVACKLPHGLVLRLAQPNKVSEPVMGGGTREVTQYRATGEPVTVYGIAHPQNAAPIPMIVGGFALTPNVSGEFWNKWLEQNKEHAAVTFGLIFAYASMEDASAAAMDNADKRTGLERLDPKKLPKGLQTAKEKAEA